MSQDTERLSDEQVAILTRWAPDAMPTNREVESLAREVQASRKLVSDLRGLVDDYHLVSSALLADTLDEAGL